MFWLDCILVVTQIPYCFFQRIKSFKSLLLYFSLKLLPKNKTKFKFKIKKHDSQNKLLHDTLTKNALKFLPNDSKFSLSRLVGPSVYKNTDWGMGLVSCRGLMQLGGAVWGFPRKNSLRFMVIISYWSGLARNTQYTIDVPSLSSIHCSDSD